MPVGGVGALGVVGLRRAGVGLGGLRQRRQAAAEAPGGREQGRGVRAGSLGLRRRAFRLSVLRAVPDASVRIALRVGWRAGVGRGGAAVGADRRGQGGGVWRGGLVPPVFRGLGRGVAPRPALQDQTRRWGPASPGSPPRRRRRTRAGQGRAPPPRRTPTRRSPTPRRGSRVGGGAPLRVRWPRGLGCGRPQARAKRGERGGGGCARNVARRFPTPRRSRERLRSVLRSRPGALRAEFPGFSHGVLGRLRIMSDKAILSDIPATTTSGADIFDIKVTKRRQGFTMRE